MIEELLKSIDYKGITAEYILHHIFDKAWTTYKLGVLKSVEEWKKDNKVDNYEIDLSDEELMINQIGYQLKKHFNWCEEISFRDLQKSKAISNIFIPIDFYLTPKRLRFNLNEGERVPLNKVLEKYQKNIVVLGSPGAGKTTLLKFICHTIMFEEKRQFCCPIVIRLREYNLTKLSRNNIIGFLPFLLMEYLGLKVSLVNNSKYTKPHNKKNTSDIENDLLRNTLDRILYNFIDEMGFIILIDGFDELQHQYLRESLIKDIRNISLSLNNAKFILTSRTSDFQFDIPNSITYEICPLNDKQIKSFIERWLNNKRKSNTLLNQIKISPFYDTAIRPLTLAHLCAIFEREKKIPDKPKFVYFKIVELLLKEWDLQRSVERKSTYGKFSTDRKIEFLRNMAYLLTTKYGTTIFSRNELEECYKRLCYNFGLPPNHITQVVDEIESHNGLFVQAGYDSFEFAHKSIQEYLTALFISNSYSYFSYEEMKAIPNELAVAVALSSTPNSFFAAIILHGAKNRIHDIFSDVFLSRILVEKPDFDDDPVLAIAIAYVNKYVGKNSRQFIEELIGLSAITNSFSALSNFYYRYDKVSSEDGFIRFKRRANVANVSGIEIPEWLFLNMSMSRKTVRIN